VKTRHLCNSCGAELDSVALSIFMDVPCPRCGRKTSKDTADTRYFPETPGNKVFAVDVYVTVCKCVRVEAKDASAAEKAVNAYMDGLCESRVDREFIERLAQEGFHDAEEQEVKVSGEADEDGSIQYY